MNILTNAVLLVSMFISAADSENPVNIQASNNEVALAHAQLADDLTTGWGGHLMKVRASVFNQAGELVSELEFTTESLEVQEEGGITEYSVAKFDSPRDFKGAIFLVQAHIEEDDVLKLHKGGTNDRWRSFIGIQLSIDWFGTHLNYGDTVKREVFDHKYTLVQHRKHLRVEDKSFLCAIIRAKPLYKDPVYTYQNVWIETVPVNSQSKVGSPVLGRIHQIECYGLLRRGGQEQLLKTITFIFPDNPDAQGYWWSSKVIVTRYDGAKTIVVQSEHQQAELNLRNFDPNRLIRRR